MSRKTFEIAGKRVQRPAASISSIVALMSSVWMNPKHPGQSHVEQYQRENRELFSFWQPVLTAQ